jgi:tellurite resistance protein TerA
MHSLRMGANAPLDTSRFEAIIAWPAGAGTLDCSAYLLASNGKVRSDDDMIFYNQRTHPSGAVAISRVADGLTDFAIDLGSAPAEIQRIVICVTIEEPGRTLAAFEGATATIRSNGEAQLQFCPELGRATEVALRFVEFYRRNQAWKIRADGQGFNDGLAPLARSFGIDVAEDEAPPPHIAPEPTRPATQPGPHQPAPAATIFERVGDAVRNVVEHTARAATAAAPWPAAAPPERASLAPVQRRADSAVRLEPGGEALFWETGPDKHLGAITAKLAWSSLCGGIDGRPRPLELALGCLYELQDGRRGVVQAWDGKGRFDRPPFVQLLDAEIAGLSGSQKLRINGEHWPQIRRLALFGFIPNGAPSWRASTVSLDISATDRSPVLLELGKGMEGFGMVALTLLDNRRQAVSIERLAQFLPGHHELDRTLDWGLAWSVRPEDSR